MPSSGSGGTSPTPYESMGRTSQKQRTRAALLDQLRRMMATGATPTVEEVAAAAGISRTTAYRYFPNQDALLLAAYPQLDQTSLLADDATTDLRERFELALEGQLRIVREWEWELRAALRTSLGPTTQRPPLRGGRAVGWFADALRPLAAERPELDLEALAVRVRAVVGIEPFVWLVDVAGLDRAAACEVMRDNARAVLAHALTR